MRLTTVAASVLASLGILADAPAAAANLGAIVELARAADAQYGAARAAALTGPEKYLQGRAGLLPTVSLLANARHNRDESTNYIGPRPHDSSVWSVSVTQPLLRAVNIEAFHQWLGSSRRPSQRSRLKPPRARKGLVLRARRAARSSDTAWVMGCFRVRSQGVQDTRKPSEIVQHRPRRLHRLAPAPRATPAHRRCCATTGTCASTRSPRPIGLVIHPHTHAQRADHTASPPSRRHPRVQGAGTLMSRVLYLSLLSLLPNIPIHRCGLPPDRQARPCPSPARLPATRRCPPRPD